MAEQNFDRQVEQGYWDRMYALASGDITTDQLYSQVQQLSPVKPELATPDEQVFWNDMWLQSDFAAPEPQPEYQMVYELPQTTTQIPTDLAE